jgi:UDP-3-O-[3-hydroxymyristoyl] glucosamine N-acyltransferase
MAATTYTLAELAAKVGGEASGDAGVAIDRVAPLEDAGPGAISFFSNRKYRAAFEASRASAVVVEPGEDVPAGRTVLRAPNPYLVFAKLSTLFHPPRAAAAGASPQAFVHPTAQVDATAERMPCAFVGAGAVVGARTTLHPGVHVGEGARVGADCVVYPNVSIREGCVVGDRVILQPGCVIGSDGFGFAFDPEGEGKGPRHYKVPQVGNVVVEDDVEIGACTCVDRAALGSTVIGRGTKIDNLVQIAHNVQVGPLSIIVSQVGVSGSTKLGMGVVLAGQVGVTGHLTIGDGARIAAQSGVMNDVEPGATMLGSPARPHAEAMRLYASMGRVPDLVKKVRDLEKRLAAVEEKKP